MFSYRHRLKKIIIISLWYLIKHSMTHFYTFCVIHFCICVLIQKMKVSCLCNVAVERDEEENIQTTRFTAKYITTLFDECFIFIKTIHIFLTSKCNDVHMWMCTFVNYKHTQTLKYKKNWENIHRVFFYLQNIFWRLM